MNRRDMKREVEMSNNSHFVGFKQDRRGTVTIFEATPYSAQGVLDGFKKQLKKDGATSDDKVQMKLVKKLPDGDTGEPGGNRYEIWIDYEFRRNGGLVRIENQGTEAGSMLDELEQMQDAQRYALARDMTAMAKSLIAEEVNPLDGMRKSKVVNIINKLLQKHSRGIFHDDSWRPVHKIFSELDKNDIPYVIEKTQYTKDENGNPASKRWWVEVDFMNDRGHLAKVYIAIVASGAGTVAEPLSSYDLAAYAS